MKKDAPLVGAPLSRHRKLRIIAAFILVIVLRKEYNVREVMYVHFLTAKEAAERWGITERRVCKLCAENRIPGAVKFGWSWAIPADTEKPFDGRVKKTSKEYFDDKASSDVRIERVWSMPNKNTFDVPPISMLLDEELTDGLWIDPFANKNKYAAITNDLNPTYDTDYHLDALDFLKLFDDHSVDGVLYDPPFSPRQVSECYNDVGYSVTCFFSKKQDVSCPSHRS